MRLFEMSPCPLLWYLQKFQAFVCVYLRLPVCNPSLFYDTPLDKHVPCSNFPCTLRVPHVPEQSLLLPRRAGHRASHLAFSSRFSPWCYRLVAAQLFCALVEPNPLQSFRFDLTDAFAGDAELAADFFKCVANAGVGKTVAHFQNLSLFR